VFTNYLYMILRFFYLTKDGAVARFFATKERFFFFDRERHFIDHIISTSLLLSSSRMDIYALDSASLLDKSSRLSTITTHQIYLSSS
jgi:hypothetical protein